MSKKKKKEDPSSETGNAPGNPVYSSDQDIYNQAKKETFEEEDTGVSSDKKVTFINDGLDIPGQELDDKDEMIGEEDEENNYYSLGGDNHNDLEEEGAESDQ